MNLYATVLRCRISIIEALIFAMAFLVIPQGQDVIRAMGGVGQGLQLFIFEVMLLVWSIVTWYAARFMTFQDFSGNEATLALPQQTRVSWAESQLLRILGSSGFAAAGAANVASWL